MPTTTPNTLVREISPPPARRSRIGKTHTIEQKTTPKETDATNDRPDLAAVEAGKAQVKDHLAYFSHHLYGASRQTPSQFPRIAREVFQDLYKRNRHAQGRHFVVHQHDHPLSGSFNDSPWLHSSKAMLIMQGKACTTTCDCSSLKRAPSASPFLMDCQVIRTRSDQIAWPSRHACIICGTTS
jgi:hypothetical protein